VLTSRLGSNRVSLFGGKLHLYAADEEEAEQARTVLREANISILGEKTITPSLEDVFIYQLTRNTEEATA
jgi:ABC-2 type transport system ATP-binding protein